MVIIDKLDPKVLKAQDLRIIVLSLKMGEFNIPDEDVKDNIWELVRELPSPEHINIIASGKGAGLKDLEKNIGYIFNLIDAHGNRNKDFKVRYKARTRLDPMHKVLDYKRVSAQKEIDMRKEAVVLVRNIVKTSSIADEKGNGDLSGKLLAFASSVRGDIATYEQAEVIANDLRTAGFAVEADEFLKAAGVWDGIGNVMKGVGRGIADKAKEVGTGIKDVGTGVKETYQLGNLQGTLQNINNQVSKAQMYAQQLAPTVTDPQKSQQVNDISQMLGNMQLVGQQVYEVIMEDANQQEDVFEEEAVPQEAPSGSLPQDKTQEGVSQGQPVYWTSNSGNPMSGSIVGPSQYNADETIVKIQSGKEMPVKTDKLKGTATASLINFRIIES